MTDLNDLVETYRDSFWIAIELSDEISVPCDVVEPSNLQRLSKMRVTDIHYVVANYLNLLPEC